MLLAAGQVSAQDDGRKAFCQPARLGREFPYLDAGVFGTRHMILWPFQVIWGVRSRAQSGPDAGAHS